MRFRSVLWVLLVLLAGCGSKGAVSLVVDIPSATVKVQSTPFGAALAGQFELGLALGPESPGPATVSSGNFMLQKESGDALGADLSITDTSPALPLTVQPGGSQSVTVKYSVESGVQLSDFCATPALHVRIVGSVMDSLKGGTDPVSSPLLTPDCPPAT